MRDQWIFVTGRAYQFLMRTPTAWQVNTYSISHCPCQPLPIYNNIVDVNLYMFITTFLLSTFPYLKQYFGVKLNKYFQGSGSSGSSGVRERSKDKPPKLPPRDSIYGPHGPHNIPKVSSNHHLTILTISISVAILHGATPPAPGDRQDDSD